MIQKRPVNLDIGTIALPLAAIASITHRITGLLAFAGLALLLYCFNLSLMSAEGFAQAKALTGSGLARLVLWALLSALAYHIVAGCKHLLLDFGIGESKQAAPTGAKVVIALSLLAAAALGVWIW